jgi:hypothetical protein
MTDKWSSLLAPGVKIIPTIAFGRGFLVELPPRSSWLSQETSEIWWWCDFLHRRFTLWRQGGCWSVFGYLRYKEILCNWLTCYGLPNRGICISRLFWLLSELGHAQHDNCNVLIAKLHCWLYPHLQFWLNLYSSGGYHCKISPTTTGWDCFGCQFTATLRAMRRLVFWRGWARTPTFVDRSLVLHC